MRLSAIYKVIGNLTLKQSKRNVYAILADGRKIELEMNREADGTPYFIEKRNRK